ncbi:InlB B-repeat-containing protein [Vagococcus fluvialis]|uniref:InlB B-repeat-containing protein n=1 Tax=Vagococcus fluvialis TaxID=2738 RepID=UPI000A33DA35|nr:InlB B-repeat-containing protein [Vagococcus fluvialis]MBO0419433.1 InlB B-repeat-containing protein [Vagococcus fluvialis]OTP33299.1 hypothetical protein A5798_000028 [Enterococcus sp. 6C8_DIV0013]
MKFKSKFFFICLSIVLLMFVGTNFVSAVENEDESITDIIESSNIEFEVIVNDESFFLTEREFLEFEKSDVEIETEEDIKRVLGEIINKSDTNPLISPRLTGKDYFNWNNWQTNSIISISNNRVSIQNQVGQNRWKNTTTLTLTLTEFNDTKPIAVIEEIRHQVVNATQITNPIYNFNYSPNLNYGYYDLYKEKPAHLLNILGSHEYTRTSFGNTNGIGIITRLSNNNRLYFHPNQYGNLLNTNVSFSYNTPAANGYNNQLNKPLRIAIISRIYPQLVKSIHVNSKTGEVIQGIQNHGLKQGLNDSISVSSKNYSNYVYKSYDLYREGEYIKSGESNSWNGKLFARKQGIIFNYTPIYSVSFESNGGSSVASQRIEYNKQAARPTNPTYANKKFEGWYEDKGLTKKYDFNQPVTDNKTLYAKWISIHTVNFESNGGSNVASQKIEHNKQAVRPTDPTYTNKKFEGWYEDKELTKKYDFNQPVTDNKTLYAKWTSIHTVNFESNGGSNVASQKIEHNKQAVRPTDPIYANKKFEGWCEDKDLTKKYDFNQSITANKTLYAKWRSKILNPLDGKTPVTPIIDSRNKPQNLTTESLRIQYVSDFDFSEIKNNYLSIKKNSYGDTVIDDSGLEKNVPAFVSVIDDRPISKNGWLLQAKASTFVSTSEHEMNGAEIHLKDLNYAESLDIKPNVANKNINLSDPDYQLISQMNGNYGNKSWSLAFGELIDDNQSSGVVLSIPSGTQKKNEEYFSIIDWHLVPSIL